MEGGTEVGETTEEKDGDGHHPTEEEEGLEERRLPPASASSPDEQDLPIMHWEDLSLRIAELEKEEQERRERAQSGSGPKPWSSSGGRAEERHGKPWRAPWPDTEDVEGRRCRVSVVASRFHNHKNLQLCFINNSDSEEEEGSTKQVSTGTSGNGSHPSGLKVEVAVALRALRDDVLAEEREKERLATSVMAKRKHLDLCELHNCSLQQLRALKASLQQDIHELSSELVSQLLVRDQLRIKQDAMLLDVQDLT